MKRKITLGTVVLSIIEYILSLLFIVGVCVSLIIVGLIPIRNTKLKNLIEKILKERRF